MLSLDAVLLPGDVLPVSRGARLPPAQKNLHLKIELWGTRFIANDALS